MHQMTSCTCYWQDEKSFLNKQYIIILMEPSNNMQLETLKTIHEIKLTTPFQACDFCISTFLEKPSSNIHFQAVGQHRYHEHTANTGNTNILMNCHEGKTPNWTKSIYVTHAKIPLCIPRKSYAMKIWKTNLITHNDHTSLHRWWFEWLYCRKENLTYSQKHPTISHGHNQQVLSTETADSQEGQLHNR